MNGDHYRGVFCSNDVLIFPEEEWKYTLFICSYIVSIQAMHERTMAVEDCERLPAGAQDYWIRGNGTFTRESLAGMLKDHAMRFDKGVIPLVTLNYRMTMTTLRHCPPRFL